MSGDDVAAEKKAKSSARLAILWMLVAIGGFIPLPLIVWAGVRDTSPFLFVAFWYLVFLVVHSLLRQAQGMWRGGRQEGCRWPLVVQDIAAVKRGHLLLISVFKLEFLLFALAVTFVEPVVATVAYEFWPVAFALLTMSGFWRGSMLDDAPLEGKRIMEMLVLLVFGGAATSFAVLSESGSSDWSGRSIIGVVMAVLAALSSALGDMFSQIIGKHQPDDDPVAQSAMSASAGAVGRALAGLFIAFVGFILLVVGGGSVRWDATGLLLALAAAAVHAVAGWCFQHANHLSRQAHGTIGAQVNSLYYLTPVGALLLLIWLAGSRIDRFDLMIVGAAGVVVVNMVLHLDPEGAEQRSDSSGGYGYKALVLALWLAGAAVLFREDWLPNGWHVWSVVEYWGMIGVCATVFTLILSFRQSRLAERRRQMDELMLRIHRNITFMGECGNLTHPKAAAATALLRRVDTARHPRVLSDSYFELRKLLMNEMRPWADQDHAKLLSDLLADVEVLVNLRQQGRNFTELAVLTLFASLTVALAVAARPVAGVEPFAAWVHDTTSLVIAAAFAFLAFDLIDKRREADAPNLRHVSRDSRVIYRQPPGWRLELVAYQNKSVERIAAGLMGAVLLIGAVAMLGVKWL